MKRIPFRQHAKILCALPETDREFFLEFVDDMELSGYSVSKAYRRLVALVDICRVNGTECALRLHDSYFNDKTLTVCDRLRLRYGEDRVLTYKEKLSNRPTPKRVIVSQRQKKYWIDRGYTESEARIAVAKIQREAAKKRTTKSYKDAAKKLKWTNDFWIAQGYTEEEAEILRKPYCDKMKTDLPSMVDRYGEEEGRLKYQERIDSFKKSMLENMHTRKTGGYVSKESLRFFIPLYKACRQIGIDRGEIYFGIGGSREFFFRKPGISNTGRFVDFCIPSLKLVIEYHGTFWHYREDCPYKNPFTSIEESQCMDQSVRKLVESRGFDYFVVWSDDDLSEHHDRFVELIRNRWNTRDSGQVVHQMR